VTSLERLPVQPLEPRVRLDLRDPMPSEALFRPRQQPPHEVQGGRREVLDTVGWEAERVAPVQDLATAAVNGRGRGRVTRRNIERVYK
jgi:hypothetical protein